MGSSRTKLVLPGHIAGQREREVTYRLTDPCPINLTSVMIQGAIEEERAETAKMATGIAVELLAQYDAMQRERSWWRRAVRPIVKRASLLRNADVMRWFRILKRRVVTR